MLNSMSICTWGVSKPKPQVLVLLTLLCLLCASQLSAKSITGKVIKVKDGDTIVVLKNKTSYTIRLDGIDCPEMKQAYGSKAKQFVSAKVFGKQVRVTYTKKDRYNRYLGTVFYDVNNNLNNELLYYGLAWHYKHFNKDANLAVIEASARNKRIGLWQDAKPIPPWEFRQANRKK